MAGMVPSVDCFQALDRMGVADGFDFTDEPSLGFPVKWLPIQFPPFLDK